MEKGWTTVITPKKNIFRFNLKELWEYRDLVLIFVKRDLTAQYKQTVLGPIWFFIQPIITTIVFTVIFGKVANLPTDGLPKPLFYLNGIIIWNYFSSSLTITSGTFISNQHLFKKVYFPRMTVPLSQVISGLARFGIQFGMFLIILAVYFLRDPGFSMNFYALLTPLLLLQMAVLGLGAGMIISSLTTRYRDFQFLVGFGTQLWMYATPIVYPLSMVPQKYQFLYALNPVVPVIQFFKYGFLGAGTIDWQMYVISVGVTLLIFCIGLLSFNSVEKTFVDRV